MLRAIIFVVKVALFSVFVLLLGNWIEWDGKPVSDQLRTHVAKAERSEFADKVKGWAGDLVNDARGGIKNGSSKAAATASSAPASISTKRAAPRPLGKTEEPSDIAPSERQKLRALIQELNSTRTR